jgi:hypothetical protein
MNWYKQAKDETKKELKEKMEKWYEDRTNKHISLVQKYCS